LVAANLEGNETLVSHYETEASMTAATDQAASSGLGQNVSSLNDVVPSP